MSSIVSRKPPFSVSTSQANDFFWMSIRFGTSRTLSSRANERRVRGASMEAKTATPLGLASGQRASALRANLARGTTGAKVRPTRIAQGEAYPCEGQSALTDPVRPATPYVAEGAIWTAATIGRLQEVYRRGQALVEREPAGLAGRAPSRGTVGVLRTARVPLDDELASPGGCFIRRRLPGARRHRGRAGFRPDLGPPRV